MPRRGLPAAAWLALAVVILSREAARAQERPHLRDYKAPIHLQAFTPDGKLLVTVSWPGHWQYRGAGDLGGPLGEKLGKWTPDPIQVKYWDTAAWRERSSWDMPPPFFAYAQAVALSPDGRTLAAAIGGPKGGSVFLWSTAGGKPRGLNGDTAGVCCLAFSPDGKVLATAHGGGAIHLWNVATAKAIAACTGHELPIRHLAFSPDGKTLASASNSQLMVSGAGAEKIPHGEVKLWDAATGRLQTDLQDHGEAAFAAGVHGISFSPAGKTVAALSGTRVLLWETRTGRPRGTVPSFAVPEGSPRRMVTTFAFTPDGRALAVAYRTAFREAGEVEFWELPRGKVRATLRGHAGAVGSLAFSPDGRLLTTAGGEVLVWDLVTPGRAPPVQVTPKATLKGHTFWVESVAFSRDGKTLASVGHGDSRVRLWDAATGRPRGSLTDSPGELHAVTFTPDGTTLVAGGGDQLQPGAVLLWGASGRKLRATLKGNFAPICSLAVSRDGKLLATVSRTLTDRQGDLLIIWDLETGRERRRLPRLRPGEASSVAFSPDGKTLAAGSAEVVLWEVVTGKRRGTLKDPHGGAGGLAFSPDGRWLATANLDGTASLWDVATLSEAATLRGHGQSVHAVAFSPDGRLLATGSRDGTVKLWDAAVSWPHRAPWLQELATLRGHTDTVWSVAFSPDGRTLATGSQDRTARLWDVASK
jgi:WD40 repeat protein